MRTRTLLVVLGVMSMLVAPVSRASDTIARSGVVEPGVLSASQPIDVIARFDREVPALDAIDGLTVGYRFTAIPAVAARATPAAARALAALPTLAYLEGPKPVEFDLDTATIASRALEVWGGADPIEVDGAIVDGAGVGIAIVDTGLDATHPDFEGQIGGNYNVTPTGPVPAGPYSSHPNQGHGTHVAGIAVGTGAFSDGKYRGVAPGARVYAFNMSGGPVNLAAITFDWILENGATLDPPIRVVNNSWRCSAIACGHALNPNQAHIMLASMLAENGVTVTWSVGNERGDGDISRTNPEATNPTPGIIGVANYKDEDDGRRNGCLSSSSAWGDSGDPSTWPDVAAPGRSITSAWPFGLEAGQSGAGGRNPVTGADSYKVLTGTSMAAPHVAGVVALMLQARPSLAPAEIEHILERTADPLTGAPGPGQDGCGIPVIEADPTNTWTGANYAAGHGLVDAREAVEASIAFTGIPPEMPPVEPIPPHFLVSRGGVSEDRVLYLSGEDALIEVYPDATAPRVRAYGHTDSVEHTSAPLTSPLTFDGLEADVYMGSTAEAGDIFSRIGYTVHVVDVEHIAADGTTRLLGHFEETNSSRRTLAAMQREGRLRFDEVQTIPAGDRIRVRVSVVALPYQGVDPPVNGFWDLYTESWTPSRVTFGSWLRRPDADSRAGCERRADCAMVDAAHPYETMACDVEAPFRMQWRGPVGSALLYNCDGVVHVCEVTATEPGKETGVCERDVPVSPATQDPGAFCTYRMPDGGRGGSGRCWALRPIEDA